MEFKVPSVIRLLIRVVSRKHRDVKFNRLNVLKRDAHICQYCGNKFSSESLTLDHVLPRSKGGTTSWTNVVACCKPCNLRKADRTPSQVGMTLRKKPKEPFYSMYLLVELNSGKGWDKYLPQVRREDRIDE